MEVDKTFCSGQGWRLGYRSANRLYPALVGSDDWAIELTTAELADFCRLLYQLAGSMELMQNELMTEEKIDCEAKLSCSGCRFRVIQIAIVYDYCFILGAKPRAIGRQRLCQK
jgi:hypothetical protein